MIYYCPFCGWWGREPRLEDYNPEDYQIVKAAFDEERDHHNCEDYPK